MLSSCGACRHQLAWWSTCCRREPAAQDRDGLFLGARRRPVGARHILHRSRRPAPHLGDPGSRVAATPGATRPSHISFCSTRLRRASSISPVPPLARLARLARCRRAAAPRFFAVLAFFRSFRESFFGRLLARFRGRRRRGSLASSRCRRRRRQPLRRPAAARSAGRINQSPAAAASSCASTFFSRPSRRPRPTWPRRRPLKPRAWRAGIARPSCRWRGPRRRWTPRSRACCWGARER